MWKGLNKVIKKYVTIFLCFQIDYLQDGDEVHVIDDKDTFILMQNNIGNYHPTQDIVSFGFYYYLLEVGEKFYSNLWS